MANDLLALGLPDCYNESSSCRITGLSICSEVARGIIWRVLRTSIASQPYVLSPDTSRGFSIHCLTTTSKHSNTNR